MSDSISAMFHYFKLPILQTVGLMVALFAAGPSSSNYVLKTYNFGAGGVSTSANYGLASVTGTANGAMASANYGLSSGPKPTQASNTPHAPTLTNPTNSYDTLKLVLNPGSDPSDTKYLIAISSNGFATTNYVQTTDTIGSSAGAANFQTYALWGGNSGFTILGLAPNTTYQVKVQSLQGKYSGSAYGPTATASTSSASLTFGLTTSLSATPPFATSFGSLAIGTVQTANATANLSLTSNADNGGLVLVADTNGGLKSLSGSYTIASATADLAAATAGYGAQVQSATQTSGGPLQSVAPFNGSADAVGGMNSSLQPLLSTTGPVTAGSAAVVLLAKTANGTPAAADYTDTVHFTAAMVY